MLWILADKPFLYLLHKPTVFLISVNKITKYLNLRILYNKDIDLAHRSGHSRALCWLLLDPGEGLWLYHNMVGDSVVGVARQAKIISQTCFFIVTHFPENWRGSHKNYINPQGWCLQWPNYPPLVPCLKASTMSTSPHWGPSLQHASLSGRHSNHTQTIAPAKQHLGIQEGSVLCPLACLNLRGTLSCLM